MAQPREPSTLDILIAGSCSGCAGVLVCHPFDVVRTRVQSSLIQRGPVDCLRDVIKELGPRGLYAGFLGPFFAQALYKAVIFTTNSWVNKNIFPGKKTSQTLFLSGAIAGSLNAVIVAPVELLRTRQIVSVSHQNYFAVVRTLLSDGGVRGMFRGLIPAIARDGPGIGVYFLTFDHAKRFLTPSSSQNGSMPSASNSLFIKLLSGSFAGIAFWTLALPVDTVKTIFESSVNMNKSFALQCSDVYKSILERGGWKSLYRAWPVAIGRGIPSAAVTLTTFDIVSEYLTEIS